MATETQKSRRAAETRSQLVDVARALFAERGFAGTSTEEVVAQAGVTRGALYYHFKNKEDLFRAVVAEVEEEINAQVTAASMGEGEMWAGLLAGCHAFLDACLDPARQRIALLDGPSVLGWEVWREVGARHRFEVLVMGLHWVMTAGEIEYQPPLPLAHVLLGALNEGALFVARADDQAAARRDVGEIVERLLLGLRPAP
jgi:AcrR family transcriptional regulator